MCNVTPYCSGGRTSITLRRGVQEIDSTANLNVVFVLFVSFLKATRITTTTNKCFFNDLFKNNFNVMSDEVNFFDFFKGKEIITHLGTKQVILEVAASKHTQRLD